MTQLTLTNEEVDENSLIPITMEIVFQIEKNSVFWEGKAYPDVSSGGNFGGCIGYEGKETIKQIIEQQKDWLIRSYGRRVKEKIKIKNIKNEKTIDGIEKKKDYTEDELLFMGCD